MLMDFTGSNTRLLKGQVTVLRVLFPPTVVTYSEEEEAAAEKALRLILDLVKISKAHSNIMCPEVTRLLPHSV